MSRWYVASNYTPADDQSIQALPNPGAYTDLDDGDKCFVYNAGHTDFFVYDASSATAQNIPHVITPDGNAGNGRWLKKEFSLEGRNGFETTDGVGPLPDSQATIGVSGTTITLTYVADYSFYVQGAKYTVTSGNKTVEITDVEGLHWIYFDNTGTLQIQAPGGSTDDLILQNCLVAAAYWDATNNVCILLFDERHAASMSPVTHYHLHETLGAQFETGLGLSGFSTNGDGTAAAHAQFDLGSGEFHDEDNEVSIAADADATIDTFYRLGVGGNWRKISATANYPVCDPQTGSRMDWNDYNGGTWQLAEVSNNDYVLTHYFATNDQLGGGVIGIMGQGDYANLPAAQAGAETELNSLLIGTLPLPEILPIATVIWKTTNGSSNQVAGAIFSVSGGGDYVDWRTASLTGAGVIVSDHESLAGLLGGAAADHYHVTGAQHTSLTGEIIDGSDTDLHVHDTLTKSGTDVVIAQTNGADIKDGSANTPITRFLNSTDTVLGQVQLNTTDFYLKIGAALETGLQITLNAAVALYYDNIKAMETTDEGIEVFDTSGTAPAIDFRSDANALLARIQSSAGALTASLWNGATWETAWQAVHNGAFEGYYDGTKEMETISGGLKATNSLTIAATTNVTGILDEDDMASDSAVSLATQQSIKAYVRDNAGDPALPKLDFYQDWLQETKYQNSTVVTMISSGVLIDSTTMDFNIEEKRYDFTVGETITTDDLYDSSLSLTNITEAIADLEVTDSVAGTFQISNDGGSTWITITDTSQVVEFVTSDIDLRLKYTAGGTGYIEHMGVLYNPDTVYSPATEVINFNDNIIINGDFDLWQRGVNFPFTTSSIYTADRFEIIGNSGAGTMSRNTAVPTQVQSGHTSRYSYLLDVTTADAAVAAGDFRSIRYIVEGYDAKTLYGNYMTLSFWVRATKAGTYCVSFRNRTPDRSYVAEYTISASNTWEYQTITVNHNESSGTWETDNSEGIDITWSISCGSTYHTTADAWQTGNYLTTSNQVNGMDNTANYFYLSQVRLERGQVASQFVPRLFDTELRLCQRYYYKTYNQASAPGTIEDVGSIQARADGTSDYQPALQIRYPVPQRVSATQVWYSTALATANYIRNHTAGTNITLSSASNAGDQCSGRPRLGTVPADNDWLRAHMTADAEF